MPGRFEVLAAALLLAATLACEPRRSSAGFRLPDVGDPEKGRTAFVQFQCFTCHEVPGEALPKVPGQPAVLIKLGGEVDRAVSDGYLVTSIIHPSYKLAAYPKDVTTRDGKSRMPHYDDMMTVRQLTDLIAYLQSHYKVAPPIARRYEYN